MFSSMTTNRLLPTCCLAVAVLLAGCTQHAKNGKTGKAGKGTAAKKAGADKAKKKVAAPKPHNQKSKAKVPPRPPRPTKLVKRPPRPPELAGSHILIAYKGARRARPNVKRSKEEALKLAKKLTAQLLKAPKTFADVAKKSSNGPSAAKGGSLGVWRKGRMVPAFDKAISALAVGAISKEPVETPFGFHVMKRNALPQYVAGAHLLVGYKGARRMRPTVTRSEAEAKTRAEKLVKELKAKPKEWSAIVAKNSDGPAAKRGGKIGVWREGRTFPAFDKALKPMKVGQISAPVKTMFGYHIFKRLPVPNELAGSHILIAYKGAMRAAGFIKRSKDDAKKLATELAEKLKKDPASFPQLALKNSDGPTARFGGNLGIWHQGMMAKAFDEAILELKDGQITAAPVETPFGFHIIRRNSLTTAKAGDKKEAAKK